MERLLTVKIHLMFMEDNLETPYFEFCKKFNLDYVVLTRSHFSRINTYCLNTRTPFELIAPGKEHFYFNQLDKFGTYNICLYANKLINEKSLTTLLKCLTMGQDHAMILEKMDSLGKYPYVKNGHINFDPKNRNEYCVVAYGFRKKAKKIPPIFESILNKKAFSAQKQSWIFSEVEN